MQKNQKFIMILIITCIIISIILFALVIYLKDKNDIDNIPDEVYMDSPIEVDNTMQRVTIRNNYYIAKACVEMFYTYYSEMFKDPLDGYLIKPEEGTIDTEALKKESIEKVYSLLDEEYIQYKQITLDNITSKLPEVKDVVINIKDMYVVEKSANLSAYFVYGSLKYGTQYNSFSIMVKVDRKNNTYKVLLGDYVEEYYKDLKIDKQLEFTTEEEIEKNSYNKFDYESVSDEEYINDLFTHYKNSLRENKEKSYELLDEEYKKQCFDNVEEYLSYLETNYRKIVTANLDSYGKNKNGNYTEYLFKDSKGNYYIFRETAPFEYTVMLDSYVIPTADFTEQYNDSSEVEKVILNIKKFFMGIENKNYGYSYNLLSETFRSNEFPTKADFTNYIKQNLFEENEVNYTSYEKKNGLYIYNIEVTDATGNSSEEKTFNIIVRLNGGTDFEMSFERE